MYTVNLYKRKDKVNYYLDVAEIILERGTCIRRNFGAVIVKDDVIVSTGYTGAPRGRANCSDLQCCTRERLNIPKGQRYELCRSVHAEANAIIAADYKELLGATLYLCCRDAKSYELYGDVEPCAMCKRLIINAGIKTVVVRTTKTTYKFITVNDWIDNDDSLTETQGY